MDTPLDYWTTGQSIRMDQEPRILHTMPELQASIDRLTAALERLNEILNREHLPDSLGGHS